MINYELLNKGISEIGIEADRHSLDRFDLFAERLVSWNKHINLTAITDPDEIVAKHFIDSLYILKYVNIASGSKVIDVGTGAGFPGVPLFIARPKIEITFVDSMSKRLRFVKDVLSTCGLAAEAVHARAEELGKDAQYREQFDFATARAVAPLSVLCEYCLPFVKVGGIFIAMKGSQDETADAMNAIDVLGGRMEQNVSFKLSTGEQRHIILIRKVSQTPTKYPRKTKKIESKPL